MQPRTITIRIELLAFPRRLAMDVDVADTCMQGNAFVAHMSHAKTEAP